MNKFDGRIVIVGIDSEGNRNSRLEYDFPLATPPEEEVVIGFLEGFRKAFDPDPMDEDKCFVLFECKTTYLPLGVTFHWELREGLASNCISPCVVCPEKASDCPPRDFFLRRCEDMCFMSSTYSISFTRE